MTYKLTYFGVDMSSDDARKWVADESDLKVASEMLELEIAITEDHHQDPIQITMEKIKGVEWKSKQPEESSDDVIFSSNIKAYDPNQKRGEAGTPQGGRWVKDDGAISDLKTFSSYDDLYRGLNNELVDQGRYGAVFDVGVEGFLLKASSDDPAYEKYIKFIEEKKPESRLYPKVKESWNLDDGSFSTLVERVTPALKRADAYQIEDMLDIMAMGEELPDNYKKLASSLGFNENDYSNFLDSIKNMGDDDIHVGNIGIRDNGELVIFDPVKPIK